MKIIYFIEMKSRMCCQLETEKLFINNLVMKKYFHKVKTIDKSTDNEKYTTNIRLSLVGDMLAF